MDEDASFTAMALQELKCENDFVYELKALFRKHRKAIFSCGCCNPFIADLDFYSGSHSSSWLFTPDELEEEV